MAVEERTGRIFGKGCSPRKMPGSATKKRLSMRTCDTDIHDQAALVEAGVLDRGFPAQVPPRDEGPLTRL
jgi:hypothetical protein